MVTLSDLSKFEDLLSGVLDAGANYVHNVKFQTTELRKYRDQARALAIKAAQEKATALAGELSQELGEPVTITEEQSSWQSWYGYGWGSGWSSNPSQNVVVESGSSTLEAGSHRRAGSDHRQRSGVGDLCAQVAATPRSIRQCSASW